MIRIPATTSKGFPLWFFFRPFLLADDVRETFCAKFELCRHPAAAAAQPLHGVALLTASAPEDGGAGAALMEAVCLDPGGANGDDREGEVRWEKSFFISKVTLFQHPPFSVSQGRGQNSL